MADHRLTKLVTDIMQDREQWRLKCLQCESRNDMLAGSLNKVGLERDEARRLAEEMCVLLDENGLDHEHLPWRERKDD